MGGCDLDWDLSLAGVCVLEVGGGSIGDLVIGEGFPGRWEAVFVYLFVCGLGDAEKEKDETRIFTWAGETSVGEELLQVLDS